MPSIEDIVQAQLSGPLVAQWAVGLRAAVLWVLGEHAAALFDCDAVATLDPWDRLDDPLYRARVLEQSPLLPARCGLVSDADIDTLRRAIRDAGFGRQSATSIRRRIAAVTPALLRLPASAAELSGAPFVQNWRFVADAIARQVYSTYRRQIPTTAAGEWRLVNRLILIDYFRHCRLPEARLVRLEIGRARQGFLSVRGTLVCTASSVSEDGAEGDDVPVSPPPAGTPLSLIGLSDGLASLSREATATAANQGVMQRLAAGFMAGITPVMRQARLRAFTRYENSLLTYIALANIEQLLRGWADRNGINHLREGGLPAPVHRWVGDLVLPTGLQDDVEELFHPARANLRNRVVHSGFLVTESKSFQDNIAIGDPARYGFLLTAADPYSPENVASLAIRCLQQLDATLAASGGLGAGNLAWAGRWCLTPGQLRLGRQLYCDLIPRTGGPTLRQADEWREHLSCYFRAMMPGLGQFFRLAYAGFMRPFSPDSYVILYAFGLIFEAVYRLTVHLIGEKVLQETESGGTLRFQYFMLDNENLCGPQVLARLCEYLDAPGERNLAMETLQLAVQGRNSLAHGALVRLDDMTFLGLGHLFLKSIQALVGAGEFHMTREAAWYRWNTRRERTGIIDGYHLEDWSIAETAVLARIASAGATISGRRSPPAL